MKRILVIGLVVILVLAIAVIAGCGGESTETTQTETTMPMEEETEEPSETMEDDVEESMPATSIPEATAGAYTDLTSAQAKELIDTTPGLVIIDVSPHYDEGHLPGAVHYYLGDGSLENAIPTLDKNATYLVYCHVDNVAIQGAQALVNAGFTKVYRLQGNYSGWVNAGYPVEK